MKSTKEFKSSGEYLPMFMRDSSDQNLLFKFMDMCIFQAKRRKYIKDGHRDFLLDVLPSRASAQIYVIDFFLWIMAQHGYTLQRCRKHIEGFDDIGETLNNYQSKSREIHEQHLVWLKEMENEKTGRYQGS